MKRRTPKRRKAKYIDPVDPYTGMISIMVIMRNIMNGHTKFPKDAGKTTR